MPFLGKSPSDGNHNVLLDAITTSATATYNLTKDSVAYTPVSAQSLMVSLNGVTQAPIAAYTVSGSTIVFASALTSNDVIDYVIAFEGPRQAISASDIDDGTITTAMIADNAITSAKIGVDVIVAEDLAANSITVSELTDDAVTQAKIADDAVDEARLQISNSGTNGHALTYQSGNTGKLTWAAMSGGVSGITSSADATAMTIDSSERIVTPSQPLFSASSISAVSGGSLHSVTPIYNIAGQTSGTVQAVSFGKIWANVGSHWSNTTGYFTVPVAGRYYCYFNNNYHAKTDWPNAQFMHNDMIIATAWMNVSENASSYSSLVASTIVVAAVNDKLWPGYRSDYNAPHTETNLGYHSCQILLIG
tara:strand:+ start:997 stop:2085 length:1089 start_codon:yes stop_codon:yes gene_type:complete